MHVAAFRVLDIFASGTWSHCYRTKWKCQISFYIFLKHQRAYCFEWDGTKNGIISFIIRHTIENLPHCVHQLLLGKDVCLFVVAGLCQVFTGSILWHRVCMVIRGGFLLWCHNSVILRPMKVLLRFKISGGPLLLGGKWRGINIYRSTLYTICTASFHPHLSSVW